MDLLELQSLAIIKPMQKQGLHPQEINCKVCINVVGCIGQRYSFGEVLILRREGRCTCSLTEANLLSQAVTSSLKGAAYRLAARLASVIWLSSSDSTTSAVSDDCTKAHFSWFACVGEGRL